MIGQGRLHLSREGIATDGVVFFKILCPSLLRRCRKIGNPDDKGMIRKSESAVGTWFFVRNIILFFLKKTS